MTHSFFITQNNSNNKSIFTINCIGFFSFFLHIKKRNIYVTIYLDLDYSFIINKLVMSLPTYQFYNTETDKPIFFVSKHIKISFHKVLLIMDLSDIQLHNF
jgi:hypothetical protein